MTPAPDTIHGCALVIGETGILIRGRSGAGKSSLVMALLAAAAARPIFARLVADDRVALHASGDRLIAAPHPAIAGLIEERGSGVLPLGHERGARIAVVIALIPGGGPRLPSEAELTTEIDGIVLRRMALPAEMAPETAARRLLSNF